MLIKAKKTKRQQYNNPLKSNIVRCLAEQNVI